MDRAMRAGATVALLLVGLRAAAAQGVAHPGLEASRLDLPDVSSFVRSDPVPPIPRSTGGPRPPRGPDAALPCPRQGAGFVRVPGSATCVRISGRAVGGIDVGAQHAAPVAAGQISIDTRTDSDLGPVRGFVRLGHGRP